MEDKTKLDELTNLFGGPEFNDMFTSFPSYPYGQASDSDDSEARLRELLEGMAKNMPTPYEQAEKEMDRQLKEKGLPSMKIMISLLENDYPEYFL